ncbi:MAG: AbrB/MazE/SpoVT family DNA-binding domain-containing protein [Streptococcaceae bacterium]|jgi:AbrB family looped-hinge helix DNA binding protein|nr:AbrB/MazE/SpoVT family DNA-binding domain-containing protein [Streptococcaceae bacterium]
MEVKDKIEATISSKGQVTVPINIRKKLNAGTGTKITFVIYENGMIGVETKKKPTKADIRKQMKEHIKKFGNQLPELAEEDAFLNDFEGDIDLDEI